MKWLISILALSLGTLCAQTSSQLANNLTATSTSFSVTSSVVTIVAANTFASGAWVGISKCTNALQLNGQVLLTNGSTTSSQVVGTLYTTQKVAEILGDVSSTADTTCFLQGQGWQPFVMAPFPAPAATPTLTTNANLDDSSAGWDSPPCYLPACNPGGNGTPTGVTQTWTNSSPSLDGNSMLIGFTGQSGLPSGQTTNALFAHKSGADDAATYFIGTYHVYLPSITNIQALEYDQAQFTHGQRYMMGSECDSSVYASGFWRVWNQFTSSWVTTGATCALLSTPNVWHTITWVTYRIPGDTSCAGGNPCMYYQSLTVDNTTYPINLAEPSAPSSDGDNIVIQAQIDLYNGGGSTSEYIDEMSISYGTQACPGGNGSPGCALGPGVNTWAYDFSIPCSGSFSAPCVPIVQLTDTNTFSSHQSCVPSMSGESNDRSISQNDGFGNYMYACDAGGRYDIFSGHIAPTYCGGSPCFVSDVIGSANSWTQTPVNYGVFSRNPANRPGPHEALWYALNLNSTCAVSGSPNCAYAPVLQKTVLTYASGKVTGGTPTNLYSLNTCPGYGWLTVGTGLGLASAMMIDNFDNNVLVAVAGGLQGSVAHHLVFVISLANGTCQTFDTEGYSGTNLNIAQLTSGHGGSGWTVGNTATLACGGQVTIVTVSSGAVTGISSNTSSGTNCFLGPAQAATGAGTGLEIDVTAIGKPGTTATLYAPIASSACSGGANFTLTCESPITTSIDVFGIHNCGMLSNGLYADCSGWGTTGQGCFGCDYVSWVLSGTPALVGSTNGNLNGHGSIGYNWKGNAQNPEYFENRPIAGTTDTTCSNILDCQLLFTLNAGCSTSPGGAQMHSAQPTPLNDDTFPVVVTSSVNSVAGGAMTNPPNFTCGLGQNSLFQITKAGASAWYMHYYENANNTTENFEGPATIGVVSPDGVLWIGAMDAYSGFAPNLGLGLDNSSAPFVGSFAILLQGPPGITLPVPPLYNMLAKSN